MKNSNEQKLTEKWIKTYKKESDEHLLEVYEEDFKGRSTPRREEDRARRNAIMALVGNKLPK